MIPLIVSPPFSKLAFSNHLLKKRPSQVAPVCSTKLFRYCKYTKADKKTSIPFRVNICSI